MWATNNPVLDLSPAASIGGTPSAEPAPFSWRSACIPQAGITLAHPDVHCQHLPALYYRHVLGTGKLLRFLENFGNVCQLGMSTDHNRMLLQAKWGKNVLVVFACTFFRLPACRSSAASSCASIACGTRGGKDATYAPAFEPLCLKRWNQRLHFKLSTTLPVNATADE